MSSVKYRVFLSGSLCCDRAVIYSFDLFCFGNVMICCHYVVISSEFIQIIPQYFSAFITVVQIRPNSWWSHQMGTFSALLAFCAGNSPVAGEFSSQRLVTQSFDVFFDLRLNKRLSKQSRRRWFETQSRSLWRHCNVHGNRCTAASHYRNHYPNWYWYNSKWTLVGF